MTVTAEHVAALRVLLTAGDSEPFTRLAAASPQDMRLGALTVCALVATVRSRFAAGWSRADVIRYVARMRTRDGFDDILPSLAEDLLLVGLANQPLPAGADPAASASAQFALLTTLTDGVSEAELDQVLDDAREQAEQWLRRHSADGTRASVVVNSTGTSRRPSGSAGDCTGLLFSTSVWT